MDNVHELITYDFNIPNNNNELSKADEAIEKLRKSVNHYNINVELITDNQFIILYERIIKVLDYVGRLSMPAFFIENELEELYKINYLHAPQLGKMLWLEHYEEIHKPYNKLKNRCFKLLDDLDEYYIELYDKNPPNWNP